MKRRIKSTIAFLVLASITAQACWVDDYNYKCGVCAGNCIYLVVCGINKNGVSLCNGSSSGRRILGVTTASSGAYLYGSSPTFCGAQVSLVPGCCGGARTTTTDWSAVNEEWPIKYGCKRT